MTKEYIKPQTDVIQLKPTTQMLVGSPDSIPYSKDPLDVIDDPEDIH